MPSGTSKAMITRARSAVAVRVPRPRASVSSTIAPSAPVAPAPARGAAMLDGLSLISVPKSCDVLAERLQQEILSGVYAPGSALPAERDLVSVTGLSRGSVREALRILEAQGLVITRPGRYGGSVVSRPTVALVAGHINAYARGRGVSLAALVEARLALEPTVAALAARNRTDADLDALRAIAIRLDAAVASDVPRFLDENAQWHAALAAASHNDLLRAFTASIAGLMFHVSRIESFASEDVRQRVSHAHRRILDAIEAKDVDLARSRTERDVQAYGRHLESALKEAGETLAGTIV